MSTKPKKYIFVNGVMKANPDYQKPNSSSSAAPPALNTSGTKSDLPLAVVCSMADVESATKLQAISTGAPMQLSPPTAESLMFMQEDEFLEEFHSLAGEELDGGDIIDALSEYFIQYEVSFGCIPSRKMKTTSLFQNLPCDINRCPWD